MADTALDNFKQPATPTPSHEELQSGLIQALQVVDDIVLKYTKLTQADLDEINNKKLDKRFTAEEALALKICDEVL